MQSDVAQEMHIIEFERAHKILRILLLSLREKNFSDYTEIEFAQGICSCGSFQKLQKLGKKNSKFHFEFKHLTRYKVWFTFYMLSTFPPTYACTWHVTQKLKQDGFSETFRVFLSFPSRMAML